MDDEEPGAAQIISIALNKKNEAAMKTGHLEIMSTLVLLCKPDPTGVVLFEPVMDKLVELFGSLVDHPDFVFAFRLVCDAGGAASKHMNDLFEFTTVYVNEKLRKMRMEVYAIVAPYPIDYPKIKRMLALNGLGNRPQTKDGVSCLPTLQTDLLQDRNFR